MNELKATPGDWFVCPDPVTGGYRISTTEIRGIGTSTQRDDHPLSAGGISWDEALTNAHLMAASKELYVALEGLLEAYDDGCQPDWAQPYLQKAYAARAKARGEQP